VTSWVGIVTLVHCKILILLNDQDIRKRDRDIEEQNSGELEVTNGINAKRTACMNDRRKLLHGLLQDHHVV
jgi:hypothetical protein